MTLDEFGMWLEQHPQQWRKGEIPSFATSLPNELAPALPGIYLAFLERFGSMLMLDDRLVFPGPHEIAGAMKFMRGLNQPEEGVVFDHLVPFCDRTANMWYFCFDGEKVLDFDPLDPFSIEHVISSSFEEFLSWIIRPE